MPVSPACISRPCWSEYWATARVKIAYEPSQPSSKEESPLAYYGKPQDAEVDHQDVREHQPDVRQVLPHKHRRDECPDDAQDADDHGVVAQREDPRQRHDCSQQHKGNVGPDELVQREGGVDGEVQGGRAARGHRLRPSRHALPRKLAGDQRDRRLLQSRGGRGRCR